MVTDGMVVSGIATFMPKMLENKFRVSASWAAMLSGKLHHFYFVSVLDK